MFHFAAVMRFTKFCVARECHITLDSRGQQSALGLSCVHS